MLHYVCIALPWFIYFSCNPRILTKYRICEFAHALYTWWDMFHKMELHAAFHAHIYPRHVQGFDAWWHLMLKHLCDRTSLRIETPIAQCRAQAPHLFAILAINLYEPEIDASHHHRRISSQQMITNLYIQTHRIWVEPAHHLWKRCLLWRSVIVIGILFGSILVDVFGPSTKLQEIQ